MSLPNPFAPAARFTEAPAYHPGPTPPADHSAPKPRPAAAAAPDPAALRFQTPAEALADALAFYDTGLGNGETTHWPCLDDHWTWMKKEITCLTGYPNHGKSRLIHFVMLIKAALKGWKFAVYVPENESDFYAEMAQMLVGRTANLKFAHARMSRDEYTAAVGWLTEHFYVVTAPEGCTPKQLLTAFAQRHAATPLDGVLIDPWNQLSHDFQSREDIYLSEQYSALKRFAIKHELAVVMTAHPAGSVKDKNGKLVVPDAYSISGGKMTNNKFDNVLAMFRPDFPSPACELWIHKIKKQGRVGKPGMIELTYDVPTNRYTPRLGDATSPLDAVGFNAPGAPYNDHNLPASQFDEEVPF